MGFCRFRYEPCLRLVVLGAWFGIIAGMIEGIVFLAFQRLGWMSWAMSLAGVSVEILWVAALFDALWFGAIGAMLGVVAKLFPRLPMTRIAVWVFAFLTFFDWLATADRVRHSAMIILAAGLAALVTRWFWRNESRVVALWRGSVPWAAAALAVTFVSIQGGGWMRERMAAAKLPPAKTGTPNIIVIVVDTLRADHVSAYGYSRTTTPNIDRLAQEGVLFENAIATSSWTLPAHASLLTGRYQYEHGAEKYGYDGRYTTIAEAFRGMGYRTGGFSANTLFFTTERGFGRGFMRFEDYFCSAADMMLRTLYGRKFHWFVLRRFGEPNHPARRLASDVTDSTLRWIDRDRSRPFFVFLNYFDTHDPYDPPQPYRSRFSRVKSPGGIFNTVMLRNGDIYKSLTPEQVQSEIDAYDGAIAYVDDSIGRLVSELERRDLLGNTIVLITSDHGEAFGEHGLLGHSTGLYRELIHVPLIIWSRWRVPAGVTVRRPVSGASLPATLMQMIGADQESDFPGPSLVDMWQPAFTEFEGQYPLAELTLYGTKYKRLGVVHTLLDSRWHYIRSPDGNTEIFDWVNDPRESKNLADSTEGRKLARQFAKQLPPVDAWSAPKKDGTVLRENAKRY